MLCTLRGKNERLNHFIVTELNSLVILISAELGYQPESSAHQKGMQDLVLGGGGGPWKYRERSESGGSKTLLVTTCVRPS